MTVGELVSMILDELKISSDDAYFTEDHVIFLCKKYRAFLLKKERDKEKNSQEEASEFETQEICLDLEKVAAIDGSPCTGGYYLRSTKAIPKVLEGSYPRVYPTDYFQGAYISYISRDRMRYVGTNKYLLNIIYACLGADLHLYLNSVNPQFFYLEGEGKVRMSAVFEDFDKAKDLLCESDDDSDACDVLDMTFPIRDYLVPPLIELVVKELSGFKYQPTDKINNASDNLEVAKQQ